jgi:predicted extracellular nuclease
MPTTLTAGDIAIVGFNTSTTDGIRFLVLTDITAGTTFNVTDNGWQSTGSFRAGEGVLSYTAPTDITAGTVLNWTNLAATNSPGFSSNNPASFALNASGDSLIVYSGALATPTLIYALNSSGAWNTNATSAATSAEPTVANGGTLVTGVSTVALITPNAYYSGSTTSGTKSQLLAAISDSSKWTGNAALINQSNWPSTFSLSTTGLPTVNLSASSIAGSEAGTTQITLTATASSTLTSAQTVDLSVAGTGITAADYTLSANQITIANGTNSGSVTFTVVDDVLDEGLETAILTISNPSAGISLGSTTVQNITITDNNGVAINTAPTIQADNETIIDPEKVSVFLNAPTNSPAAIPTAFISGVINDPTDPAKNIGIEFNIADAETPGTLTVTATSSNAAVVSNANLTFTGTGGSRNLKINPTGVGFSDITVTVNDGSLSSSYVIKYAASAAGSTTSRFLTGASNASTAIAIDSQYMLVGDDENQALRLYDRTNSGLAINSFDYTSSLGLTDTSGGIPREVDIEASAQLGNRIYWLGSQSNTDPAGNNRPNRDRVFATDKSGSGNNTALSYAGRYDFLREDIIAWDVSNGHGKGANFYGLAASAATGVSSKANNGYNIEGLEFAPDNTTAYVAFRAPQEPTGIRTKALIVPVTNFTSLLNTSGGGSLGSATFGAPIELDLGGRGIREIRKNANNQYVIIAGAAGTEGVTPNDFQLYTWTGVATDAPVFRTANLSALNVGGSFESIVEVPTNLTSTSQLQLLVDNGDTVFYNNGVIAKDITANFQKSRSEIVTLGNSIAKIHDIQGSGTTFNTSFGGSQTIEGIVTRAFTGSTKLNGFFVQEEDADADSNAATSEAIFVFDTSGTAINVGDKVRVTGSVKEFTSATSSLTELDTAGVTTNIVNLGDGTLPTTTSIQLPVVSTTDLESYEGMLVNISAATGDLTVTENFQLGRFGQVVLAANGSNNQTGTDARFDQYTQFNAPSVSGYTDYLADIAKRKIYLDDGSGTQNLDPILFGRNGNPLSATNTLRSGDTVANITGILDERFEGYRIQTSTAVNFTAANPRPTTPPAVGGTLKVANFNILNYFNTLGSSTTTFTNDAGQSLTLRGANNAVEFGRQRDKIIQAIINSGADVLGLNELQNNGFGAGSAIQNLVDGLNAIAGLGTYAFIDRPGTDITLSTDAITVGMIYKPGAVTPVGNSATIALGDSPDFDLVGRRPLAQTFRQNSNQEQFTAVVNHFKSKGSSSGGAGDTDAGDGQGLSNGTRTRQAQALATWLGTNPTGTTDRDYIILGDLNAYAQENPLTTLASAGYNNLLPVNSYSYLFDGQVGSLDHALGNRSLAAQVTGSEKWHINADEPNVLDYNTEFKTAGQVTSLYDAAVYRSSDHDPVIVGLNLRPANTVNGTAQADNLSGTSGNDNISGFAGNDALIGGAGTDTLNGGTGDDDYGVYSSDTVINEVNDEGKDSVWTAVNYTLSDNVETMYLLGNITGTGNNGNNTIIGYGSENHTIYGLGGDDLLISGAGIDIIDGGDGADHLNGGIGNDDLQGGAGNDVLEGSGDSTGTDRFAGGAGDDAYGVYSLNTNVVEDANNGNDTVWTVVNYSLTNNVENLVLVGDLTGNGNGANNVIVGYGSSSQTMNGLGGNDTIIGGEGNDTIDGGDGADYLDGGVGNDNFVFRFGQSSDVVTDRIADFAIGTDKIDLFSPAGVAAPAPTSFSRANDNSVATTLTTLAQAVYADADGTLGGNQALINGGAAIVVSTGAGIAGTYLIIDDGNSVFNSNDLVVNITGLTGSTPALGSIAVNSFFNSSTPQVS